MSSVAGFPRPAGPVHGRCSASEVTSEQSWLFEDVRMRKILKLPRDGDDDGEDTYYHGNRGL